MTKKVGLIGHPVAHSKSPFIHAFLHDIPYHLFDSKDLTLLDEPSITGLNVTAPLKEKAYLKADFRDDLSKKSNSVNTLVKKDGMWHGYNTDILALEFILDTAIIKFKPNRVAILGNGATSRSVQIALEKHSTLDITIFARHPKKEERAWNEWVDEYDFIIQTTPLGMEHSEGSYPFDTESMKQVKWIFDLVYAPFHTPLLGMAKQNQIPYQNGLSMLIKQARFSAEKFTGKLLDPSVEKEIYKALILDSVNIVLIGMPYSGKTTFGKELASYLKKPFIDTDELIYSQTNKTPKDWILSKGEKSFREIEKNTIHTLKSITGSVISTGGGSVLDLNNQGIFVKNSLIVWLNYEGIPNLDDTRPLSPSIDDYLKLKKIRHPIYKSVADLTISYNTFIRDVKDVWEGAFNDYIHRQWT